jgi:hypothetical protein
MIDDIYCQARIQDPFVSQIHLRIRIEKSEDSASLPNDTCVFVDDLSRNGTFVNGVKIGSDASLPVNLGDVISLIAPGSSDGHQNFHPRFSFRGGSISQTALSVM